MEVMKKAKTLFALLLALTMVFGLAATAFAAEEKGSITIKSADNVSVKGKTFNAYKILDVVGYTGEGATASVAYSVPEEMKPFYKGRYDTIDDTAGDYGAKVAEKIREEKDRFAFAAEALGYAKDHFAGPTGSAKADQADAVTIKNLPLGYYVVEDAGGTTGDAASAPISALIVGTTDPDVTITLKADKPTIDKTIEDAGDYNNAAVGDTVTYTLTSKVPDMTGYKKYYFVVNDTLSKGLTFGNDVEITVGGQKLQRAYKKATTDAGATTVKYYSDEACTAEITDVSSHYFTVSAVEGADETSVEIVFVNFIQYADKKDATIEITYSATINEDAVIGTAGNANEVTLTYSNNPNTEDGGTPDDPDKPEKPVGTTPVSKTYTYVTGITLKKVDPNGNSLTGAKFELSGTMTNIVLVTGEVFVEDENGTYWLLKDGTYTTTDPATEGIDQEQYADKNTKYTKKTEKTPVTTTSAVKATAFVDETGTLTFEGLSMGDYTITELVAPAGYNLLTDPITVKIGWKAPDAGSTQCTWSYEWKLGAKDLTAEEDAANTVQVENKAGTELPSTGGAGTMAFYVIGSILLVGAGILLVTKRRMNTEK